MSHRLHPPPLQKILRAPLVQCSVVFAGACVLHYSATSKNVSVSMRIEFVWRIRGYVHITINTLSTRY